MRLLVIWLLGVPVAVALMCTAAALWPRDVSAKRTQARVSDSTLTLRRQLDMETMLPSVAE